MHEDSIFLTLTYDEEHLPGPKLHYPDFQNFMKSLLELRRRNVTDAEVRKALSIPFIVTGEYGEKNKRPHWHALLFNYRPKDEKPAHENPLGDKLYTSEEIASLWKKGAHDYGSVTIESASYVARYSAKKLVHGRDQDHDFHPVHKTSSKHAIGKRWIEKNWKHTFRNGFVVLPNGQQAKIPRYYVDWLKKNIPDEWVRYVTTKRLEIQQHAQNKFEKEELEYLSELMNQEHECPRPITHNKMKHTVLTQKFKRLQEKLKL